MGLLLLCKASSGLGADAISVAPEAVPVQAASSPRPVAERSPQPVAERHQGALYRVRYKDQLSYLFGTVHVGTSAFYPLAPEVSRALADSTRLVVELDTRADAAFQQALTTHASYKAGDSIVRHLSPETLAQLTAALHEVGITLASVSHLKPWLLANLLMGLELQRNGFERQHGLESHLLADAQARGSAVAELESADYQLGLFDTLGEADGERYLRESLQDLADGNSLKKAKHLINAWSSGDPVAIDELITEATTGDTVVSSFTRRTLLDRRNPEMVSHIVQLMGDSKVTFVGVGVLHLLGEHGLPQLLSQRGYQVERIY
ncbi:MAG: TraB/GumN family protein [Massilia sp.]